MKSTPTPLIIDLSNNVRKIANTTVSDANFDLISMDRDDFLSRLGSRLLIFPSGASLSSPLWEPPASMVYGKLLYGGVTRYRQLVSSNSRRPPRRAGERTAIASSAATSRGVWIQYGGTERMYEAVDMGPAAVLEFMILPKSVIARGLSLPDPDSSDAGGGMVIQKFPWRPQQIFDSIPEDNGTNATSSTKKKLDSVTGYTPISAQQFESDFKESVGGLQTQIDAIVRRVLDGRVLRPALDHDNDEEVTITTALKAVTLEAEELNSLGLEPVRGVLLYGPPGTGKTLLARQIARSLQAREPKIVSAPELLDRWVGGSEKLVRALFSDAEAELAICNGDATKSALHVVVIDEIDAVFRRRSSAEDSGEATRASVVNQILAKLDGINAISNILVIGMTNRRELLDEALLRPGRLEVQIEVPLPDREGRREILQIHFEVLRQKGRLSKPLCCAIDGVSQHTFQQQADKFISLEGAHPATSGRKRDAFKRAIVRSSSVLRPAYDLAADYATGGFSGADIAGLVRCAGSLALSRARKDGNGVSGLLITLEDVKQALEEVEM